MLKRSSVGAVSFAFGEAVFEVQHSRLLEHGSICYVPIDNGRRLQALRVQVRGSRVLRVEPKHVVARVVPNTLILTPHATEEVAAG